MKIVVCVDETESSKVALDKAVEFADKINSKIILVNVMNEEVNHQNNDIIRESTDDAIERGNELMDNMTTRALEKSSSNNLDIDSVILDNANKSIVQTIIDYISDKDIYQIFIGHRAMNEKHEKLYGSFAKEMISDSPTPVVVITTNHSD